MIRRQVLSRRLAAFVRWWPWASGCALFIGLYQLFLAAPWLLTVGMAVLFGIPLLAALLAGFGRPDYRSAAIAVDAHYSLHDSLLTALQPPSTAPPSLVSLQLRQASSQLARIRASDVFPIRLPAGSGRAFLLALLAGLALVLPTFSGPLIRSAFAPRPTAEAPLQPDAPPPAPPTVTPELVQSSLQVLPQSASGTDDHELTRKRIVRQYFERK